MKLLEHSLRNVRFLISFSYLSFLAWVIPNEPFAPLNGKSCILSLDSISQHINGHMWLFSIERMRNRHVVTSQSRLNRDLSQNQYNRSALQYSNYCGVNWQVHQLLLKLLLNYCSVEMKLMNNYCTICSCIHVHV